MQDSAPSSGTTRSEVLRRSWCAGACRGGLRGLCGRAGGPPGRLQRAHGAWHVAQWPPPLHGAGSKKNRNVSVSLLAFSLSLPVWEETLFPRKTFRSTVPVLVPALVEYVILLLPISGFAHSHAFKPTWGLSHKKTPLPTRSAGPRWPAAPRSGAPPHGSVPSLRSSAPHSRVPVAYGSGELACLRALFWRGWFCPGVCCGL